MNQMMVMISRCEVGYILVNNEGSKVREMEKIVYKSKISRK